MEGEPGIGTVTIYVAELEGDDKKGHHRSNVIRALIAELGRSARVVRTPFELKTNESGDPLQDADTANVKAQKYLSKRKGDLLILGEVFPGPRLYSKFGSLRLLMTGQMGCASHTVKRWSSHLTLVKTSGPPLRRSLFTTPPPLESLEGSWQIP